MDLRPLPPNDRRALLEKELGIDLSALSIDPAKLGHADEHNCEQMFGHMPIPVGYAGPLPVTFSSGETANVHLPLATTEGALVASVNRGCKVLRLCGGVRTESVYHGVSRSIALRIRKEKMCVTPSVVEGRRVGHASTTLSMTQEHIQKRENDWKSIGEATSKHLKILMYDVDTKNEYLFLTIYADTDEAMGMNMVTIAAEAMGKWIAEHFNLEFVTVAANVDSDKKPSKRTHDRGRGYEVTATATVPADVLRTILKTTPKAILDVAHAKLDCGSELAGAIGHNCHAANIVAALYIATGQDPAHIVEGSLADTKVECFPSPLAEKGQGEGSLKISVRCPALLVGTFGGGTTLPAQSQALKLLLKSKAYNLKPPQRLAESIGAAVLAGELSLLAALSSHHLGKSHALLARTGKT